MAFRRSGVHPLGSTILFLPISPSSPRRLALSLNRQVRRFAGFHLQQPGVNVRQQLIVSLVVEDALLEGADDFVLLRQQHATPNPEQLLALDRSEERRVGKECRSRW